MKSTIAVSLATIGVVLLVATTLLDMPRSRDIQAGGQSQQAGPTVSPSASASTSAASPAGTVTTFENATLGYRIDLPEPYRLVQSRVLAPSEEFVGNAIYTKRTLAEDVQTCLTERGGSALRSPARALDVLIAATRDTRRVPAVQLAAERKMPFTSVRPMTINGLEAAKIVHQSTGDADVFLIRANDRIYEITPVLAIQPSWLGTGWLESVATSFVAIPPQEAAGPSRNGGCRI